MQSSGVCLLHEHMGFGEPPEQGKDLLGAGHRVETRGGSSMGEKVG